MRYGILGVGLLLVASCPARRADAASVEPQVHQVAASAQGLSVNAYLIEGEHGIVAVDSALTVSDAKALRARADSLRKPLLAVLVTHGHPDHYNGVFYLIEGRIVPVYATAAVAKVIREWDGRKEKQWQPVFKDEWPPHRVFPDHEVADGARLTFDQMTFVVYDLGPAESYADSYWELMSPIHAAFIGDEVLAGSHAYTNDGHTTEWLHNLDRLSRALENVKRIYPGHGPSGDPSLFEWERTYLTKYRAEVNRLRAGADKLSEGQKKELVASMKAAYPAATNEFMIELGADTVATELARVRKDRAP